MLVWRIAILSVVREKPGDLLPTAVMLSRLPRHNLLINIQPCGNESRNISLHHEEQPSNMAVEFVVKELYGGAITTRLPNDVVDASDLRQIPDHQEVFLSDKTLTSIIFEINEYQHTSTVVSDTSDNTNSGDEAAAAYHLNDIIEAPDHFSEFGIRTTPAKLWQPSVSKYSAYQSTATIISPEVDRTTKSILPLAWQTNPAQKEQQIGVVQLLVRMQDYSTDLCIRINVPLKELGHPQSEAAQNEANAASDVMQSIIESLDIKDFGLFGAE